MGRHSLFCLALALLPFTPGCSFTNEVEACEVEAKEARVNQRGDLNEGTVTPRAATRLIDDRILVAYQAADTTFDQSEVRYAILDGSGTRQALCLGESPEQVMNAEGVYAANPVVAPVLKIDPTSNVVGAVGWVQGKLLDTEVFVRFLDVAGCPNGPVAYQPSYQLGSATNFPFLAWSPGRAQLMILFTDLTRLYRTFHDSTQATTVETIATESAILSWPAAAFAPDGRGFMVWVAYANAGEANQFQPHVRVLFLDANGDPRLPLFDLDLPAKFFGAGARPILAVDARNDRYAIALDPAEATVARPAVWVAELDANDGKTLGVHRADPDTGETQIAPSLAYLPNDNLLVAWESGHRNGTVARLFRSNFEPRFNSVSCDDTRFAVGARISDTAPLGISQVVYASQRAWIVHTGQPGYDPNGSGVTAWNLELSQLWPAK
jgi:hypothetical protein